VSPHDNERDSCLGACIRAVLDRYAARPIDGVLISDLADALNRELVEFRAEQRITLAFDGSAIRVELTPEDAAAAEGVAAPTTSEPKRALLSDSCPEPRPSRSPQGQERAE
jgi:hypothetical protein